MRLLLKVMPMVLRRLKANQSHITSAHLMLSIPNFAFMRPSCGCWAREGT